MMPPEHPPFQPPAGDLAAWPNDALPLGGGRWLTTGGNIVLSLRHAQECVLTSRTLRYWEAVALQGQGVPLNELIV